jgi:hypothetical protein
MPPQRPAQRENRAENARKQPEMRYSRKLPWRPRFWHPPAQPVDKVLNNFFADWGQVEKLSNADFLSKKCPAAIQGLPSAYPFSKRLIFFR